MKLNLGCGRKRWPGFVNVDLQDADLNCDIRKLPMDDDSVDEIHAIHVIEHFMLTEIADVLDEWRRVLKPGGFLVVELPCWDKVQKHIADYRPDNLTRWALYGDPGTHKDGYPALHKWCWSRDELRVVLLSCGFSDVEESAPKFHVPFRDMRWTAWK